MTTEDIKLKGNKLMAVFMGAVAQEWYPKSEMYNVSGIHYEYPMSGIYPDNVRHHCDQLLKYHSSWEWLMTIVDKIESLGFQFIIGNQGAYIKKWFYKGNVPEFGRVAETKKEVTFLLAMDFIEWYNQQPK